MSSVYPPDRCHVPVPQGHRSIDNTPHPCGGPSTYLHAGASKVGWPYDHSVEDTYEVPPHTWTPRQKDLHKEIFNQSELDCNALKPEWLMQPTPNEPPKLNAQVEGSLYPEGLQRDMSELKTRSALFVNLISKEKPQYGAEYTADGGVALLLYTPARSIARFDTYDDAVAAAKALNEHHGY